MMRDNFRVWVNLKDIPTSKAIRSFIQFLMSNHRSPVHSRTVAISAIYGVAIDNGQIVSALISPTKQKSLAESTPPSQPNQAICHVEIGC